jgi:uncharacterized protein (DUF58 family)
MPTLTLAQRRRLAAAAEARQRWGRRLAEAATRVSGVSTSGFILAGVAVFAWLLAYWMGGRPLYMISYGAFGALIAAWFAGRRPPPLTGDRSTLRPRVQEGEQLDVTVALRSTRRLSNLVLEERVPSLLGDNARVAIPEIEADQDVQHTYPLTCWRRGAYELGPLIARWGDPFGLTEREMVLADAFEVLVHPRIEPTDDNALTRLWEDPPFRPPISKPWPHGLEFYGMRQYQRGDDLRKVVWRAFARTGELLVRESEQGVTDKVVIVLDQQRAHHSTGLVSDSFEAACRVAASLGARHLKEGYSVILEGTRERLAEPLRGAGGRIRFLDALARASLEEGALSDVFGRILNSVPRDSHVVVVTPLLDAAAAARLRLFVDRGQSVLVVALMWLDEAVDTLATAAGLGVRIVEVGPNTNLTIAFRHSVAAATAVR